MNKSNDVKSNKLGMNKTAKISFAALIILSLIIGIFCLVNVFAATTLSDSNAPTQSVVASAKNIVVMEYNVTVGADVNIAGVALTAGNSVSDGFDGDWNGVYYYDFAAGGAWNSGSDWIGYDNDSDNVYTSAADTIIDADGTATSGADTPASDDVKTAGEALTDFEAVDKVCLQGTDTTYTGGEAIWSDFDKDGVVTTGADDQRTGNSDTPAAGDTLYDITAYDQLCTNSLDSPTKLWIYSGTGADLTPCTADDDVGLIYLGSPADGGILVTSGTNFAATDETLDDTTNIYIENVAEELTYSTGPDVAILVDLPAKGTACTTLDGTGNLVFHDTNANGAWNAGEDIIMENVDGKNTWSASADTKIAGTNPAPGTPITLGVSADWKIASVDADNGGFWNASADSIVTDVDENSFYLDQLSAITSALDTSSTINETNISSVTYWLDNGNGVFSAGTDTLLGVAAYNTSSGWYVSSLSRALAGGNNLIFVTANLSSVPDGKTIKFKLQAVASGAPFAVGKTGLFLASTTLANVTNANFQIVDAVLPTVVVTMSDYALKIGDAAVVVFNFSEPSMGFAIDDVANASGVLSDWNAINTTLYTANFTPYGNIEDASNLITVGTGWTDIAGNAPVGSTNSANYAVDTKAPTGTVTVDTDVIYEGDLVQIVTITYDEAMNNGSAPTISFTGNGSAIATRHNGAWNAANTTWTETFDLTNQNENTINIGVSSSGATDLAGNVEGSSVSGTFDVDTFKPVVVNVAVNDNLLSQPDVKVDGFVAMIDFSEVMDSTAPTVAFNPTVGTTLTNCDGAWFNTTRYNRTCDIADGNILLADVDINITGAKDAAGNTMTADASSGVDKFSIDTDAPTVAVTLSTSLFIVGQTATVIFNFSEAPVGFNESDVTVGNGVLSGLVNASSTIYTGTITPTDNLENASNVITVGTGWNDSASNPPASSANSGIYAIDTKEPTVVITMSDVSLLIGETAVVTFNFSEAPTDFNASDVTVQNGVLSNLTNSSATNYTAIFTPSASIYDITNVVTVGTGWTDAVGNAPVIETNSTNYAVNTLRPTVVITMSDYALKVGENATITFNFSAAPTGFNVSDVTVTNGNLSAFANSSATIYTALFTPLTNTSNNTNVVTVGTGWNDSVYAPASETNSSNYIVDDSVPTVSITAPLSGAGVRSTNEITFTGSELVNPECSIDDSVWVSCSSGVTTLGSVTGFSSLPVGSFTLYLRDTDLAGNIGTTSKSGVMKLSSSSGGGGGGGSSRSDEVRNNFARQSWVMVLPNQRILFKPGNSLIPVDEVAFVMKHNKASLSMNTTGYSSKPADVMSLNGALKYMEIKASDLSGNDIDGIISIKFSIDKSLVKNPNKVYMFRLVGDTWTKLTTAYLYSDESKYYYTANTPGFSYFAIGEEADAVVATTTPTTSTETTTTTTTNTATSETGSGSAANENAGTQEAQQTADKTPQETLPTDSKNSSKRNTVWFLVVAGLLIVIVIAIMIRGAKRK